jgi:hypothetical protein
MSRYQYANYASRESFRVELGDPLEVFKIVGVWDSRVRAQNFLTEDTGRGQSLGSEIEG